MTDWAATALADLMVRRQVEEIRTGLSDRYRRTAVKRFSTKPARVDRVHRGLLQVLDTDRAGQLAAVDGILTWVKDRWSPAESRPLTDAWREAQAGGEQRDAIAIEAFAAFLRDVRQECRSTARAARERRRDEAQKDERQT